MKINHWQYRTRNGRFDSLKFKFHRAVRFVQNAFLVMLALAIAGGVGASIFSTHTSTVEAQDIVIQTEDSYPVLDRIADCESGNGKKGTARHYDSNGQVLMRANTNKTIDIGKYQINEHYWGKKASELGLDITDEEDNKAIAEWIYKNKGTTDWSASQKCWYK